VLIVLSQVGFGMKVILIEDGDDTALQLVAALSENGHEVDVASDSCVGMQRATGAAYDLFVIDRIVPPLDGLAVVRLLRSLGSSTPVLFLSALGSLNDRLEGLRSGGDDYLVKPFAFEELLARMEALIRRRVCATYDVLRRVADLELDPLTRRVVRGRAPIPLSSKEFRLLDYLMQNAGQVVSRPMLLAHVWDRRDAAAPCIATSVSRLRTKVDGGYALKLIETVQGQGYRLRAAE
jgi:two-component system OmpR family response regulator